MGIVLVSLGGRVRFSTQDASTQTLTASEWRLYSQAKQQTTPSLVAAPPSTGERKGKKHAATPPLPCLPLPGLIVIPFYGPLLFSKFFSPPKFLKTGTPLWQEIKLTLQE